MAVPVVDTFEYGSWRQLVEATAEQSPGILQAIAPFGFEVTRDAAFTRKRLTRFFVYVHVAARAYERRCREAFVAQLLQRARAEMPAMWERVKLVVTDSGVTVLDGPGDSTLYVRCVRPPQQSLLAAYGRYVALAPVSITSGLLLEARRFATSASARRYVYQLTVMTAHIYRSQVAMTHSHTAALMEQIRSLPERDLLTGQSPSTPPGAAEAELYQRVVLPIHLQARRFLQGGDLRRSTTVVDFHSSTTHRHEVDTRRLGGACQYVIDCYHDYPGISRSLSLVMSS